MLKALAMFLTWTATAVLAFCGFWYAHLFSGFEMVGIAGLLALLTVLLMLIANWTD